MSVPPRPVLGSFTGGQLPLGQSQTPSKQVSPFLQTLPQAPQWLLLQHVSTQTPPQLVSPFSQVEASACAAAARPGRLPATVIAARRASACRREVQRAKTRVSTSNWWSIACPPLP